MENPAIPNSQLAYNDDSTTDPELRPAVSCQGIDDGPGGMPGAIEVCFSRLAVRHSMQNQKQSMTRPALWVGNPCHLTALFLRALAVGRQPLPRTVGCQPLDAEQTPE